MTDKPLVPSRHERLLAKLVVAQFHRRKIAGERANGLTGKLLAAMPRLIKRAN